MICSHVSFQKARYTYNMERLGIQKLGYAMNPTLIVPLNDNVWYVIVRGSVALGTFPFIVVQEPLIL